MDYGATSTDGGSLADHYARLWEAGGTAPDVFAFLKMHADAPARQRADVLLVDQRLRWQMGDRRSAECYLREFSEIARDYELIIDLVYGEIHLGLESGESPDLEQFFARFPDLGEALARQLEVAGWMQAARQGPRPASRTVSEPRNHRAEPDLSAGDIADGPSYDFIDGTVASANGAGTVASSDTTDILTVEPDRTGNGIAGEMQGPATMIAGRPGETRAPSSGSPGDPQQILWPLDVPARWHGREVVPGYEVQSELGRGGMGIVYKALDLKLNRLVALKMIRDGSHAHPEHLARFRIEAEVVARLHHPNILQIYQIGEIDGLPFVALELLEGGTLAQRLANATQPLRQAAGLLATLARAMQAAHEAGIVHRDLKPSNILFDGEGIPKVADFGLAKRLEDEEGETQTGQVMGTPSYIAPEQAQGRVRAIGPAADIYALGAILYEMLTGRPPFKGTTTAETLMLVQSEDPVPPSRLRLKIPRDLETICLKCLEKDPARRYVTAGELADDLGRFLAGEPIHARPTPAWERAAKWARRRPTTTALAAVGLVVVIGLATAAERYSAFTRDQARRRDLRDAQLRFEGLNDLDRSHRQLARGELIEARLTLSTLLAKLRSEPRLADYRRRVDDELRDVERRLAERAAREADLERFARFGRLCDEALFRDAQYAGLGHDGQQAQTRDAARAALAVFAAGGGDEGGVPGSLRASFSPGQRAEVEAGCYLMLMVLSEAVARPLAGEDPRLQADEALRLLDRAATLLAPTPAFHLRRADCLERHGNTEAARRERAQAARLTPSGAFDHLLLGQERSRRGDWDAARSHFEKALRARPDLFWGHCLLAIAELNSRPPRAAEARAELTTCLIQQPSYAWLYLLRGSACGQMGKALAAAALGAEADARFEDAEADFRKALELGLGGDLRYALLMNRGVMRFQRQRHSDAVADFEKAIALDGRHYNAYASLAQALRQLGRRDEAIEQLSKAIALEPGMAALYRGRASARLDRADRPLVEVEAALRDLEEAARRAPPGSRAAADDHARRGRLLLRLDRPRDGLAAANAALKIAPDLAKAHLVRVAALLDLRRFDEVIDSCDAALANGSPSAELHWTRGLARVARSDFASAIDDYYRALDLRPGWAEAHVARGWAYLFANAPELALSDFEAVIRLTPADPDGYAGRAAACVRLGRLREAVADTKESLRRAGPSPRLLYIAAQTYAQASAYAAAEVARRGRSAARDSLDYESRAADLLLQSLEQTSADRRLAFWRDIIAPDRMLRPLLHNPLIRQRLKSFDLSPR